MSGEYRKAGAVIVGAIGLFLGLFVLLDGGWPAGVIAGSVIALAFVGLARLALAYPRPTAFVGILIVLGAVLFFDLWRFRTVQNALWLFFVTPLTLATTCLMLGSRKDDQGVSPEHRARVFGSLAAAAAIIFTMLILFGDRGQEQYLGGGSRTMREGEVVEMQGIPCRFRTKCSISGRCRDAATVSRTRSPPRSRTRTRPRVQVQVQIQRTLYSATVTNTVNSLALTTLVVLAGCSGDPPPPTVGSGELPQVTVAPSPANVIIVSVDTLRADRLGCYGHGVPTSPEVDRFARDAVLFEHTIAQAPSTLPSHASLLTSLLPAHHGASYGLSTPLPEEIETIAEILGDAGYATAAFTGGGQLAPAFGIGQGFDLYQEPQRADTLVNAAEAAIEWLETEQTERFFLFLHTYEVHSPYTPNPEFLAKIESSYDGNLPTAISNELIDRINSGDLELGNGDLEHILACYDAEIRSTDAGFGALLAHLKATGLYEDALIVFTSDHGEEFGEHGVVGWHSHTLYDELLRVPLIVKFPDRWAAGQRVGTQVRLIDVAPTITETLGLGPVEQFTGTDLRRVVAASTAADLAAVSQQDSDGGFLFSSLRTGEWKLYPSKLFDRDTLRGEPFARRAAVKIGALWRPYRLLDLENDPGEHEDVGSANRGVRRTLREALEGQLASRAQPETQPVTVDAETEAKLKALGYVE